MGTRDGRGERGKRQRKSVCEGKKKGGRGRVGRKDDGQDGKGYMKRGEVGRVGGRYIRGERGIGRGVIDKGRQVEDWWREM